MPIRLPAQIVRRDSLFGPYRIIPDWDAGSPIVTCDQEGCTGHTIITHVSRNGGDLDGLHFPDGVTGWSIRSVVLCPEHAPPPEEGEEE